MLATQRKDYLHRVAEQGHTETAKALIATGADLNAKEGKGRRPRRKAIEYGYVEIAKTLETQEK